MCQLAMVTCTWWLLLTFTAVLLSVGPYPIPWTAEWCKACIKAAIAAHGEPEIVNTDQGSQFTSPIFTTLFDEIKTQLSMDGKGRWIDNVFIERFWRNIKYEKIYLEPSEDGIELYGKIKWYMEFYNTRRPHQSLGYNKPEQVYAKAA